MRCAVLGDPISHSLSPVLHRAGYAAHGLAWEYDTQLVASGGLGDFLAGLDDVVARAVADDAAEAGGVGARGPRLRDGRRGPRRQHAGAGGRRRARRQHRRPGCRGGRPRALRRSDRDGHDPGRGSHGGLHGSGPGPPGRTHVPTPGPLAGPCHRDRSGDRARIRPARASRSARSRPTRSSATSWSRPSPRPPRTRR